MSEELSPTEAWYRRVRAALGFGRQRFGSALPTKLMEQELSARAPRPGEGRHAGPDPYLFGTIQPDAERQLPAEAQLERFREAGAAFGTVLQELVDREPERDRLLEVHLETSYDGAVQVGHGTLVQRLDNQERFSVYGAGVLLLIALLATLGFAGGVLALAQARALGERVAEIEARCAP